MQRARAFFFVCAGVFLLAAAYHLGATSATAQQGASVSGIGWDNGGKFAIVTPNGDVFVRQSDGTNWTGGAQYLGNFWGGNPVPAANSTWGQLKARYR